MAALTADFERNHLLHDQVLAALPAKANVRIYRGALACVATATGLAETGSNSAGLRFAGVVVTGINNLGGAAGVISGGASLAGTERTIQVDTQGSHEIALSGADPVFGDVAFLVDDNTVSKVDPGAGVVVGRFLRPGNYGGWIVDISRAA
ncbi:MAG TPA: hypothetical protein VF017_15500 [Thermoanaerobaculia bacterium]|nr:hypothetical protein [Thermoanaerobaculia bacterium]